MPHDANNKERQEELPRANESVELTEEEMASLETELSRLTNDELAALLCQYERLEADFGEIVEKLDEQTMRWREKKGGKRLTELMASPEEALRRLDDPDPEIRELATHLATTHWRMSFPNIDRIERIAVFDPSPAVRTMAIAGLGRCYARTRNGRIAAILATIVRDPHALFDERQSAYGALLLVDGGRDQSIAQVIRDFPDIIDWNLVNTYLV